jgi:hypothetical protein
MQVLISSLGFLTLLYMRVYVNVLMYFKEQASTVL